MSYQRKLAEKKRSIAHNFRKKAVLHHAGHKDAIVFCVGNSNISNVFCFIQTLSSDCNYSIGIMSEHKSFF